MFFQILQNLFGECVDDRDQAFAESINLLNNSVYMETPFASGFSCVRKLSIHDQVWMMKLWSLCQSRNQMV